MPAISWSRHLEPHTINAPLVILIVVLLLFAAAALWEGTRKISKFPKATRYDSDLLMVELEDGTTVYVCDTCGGNCGQCGITDKLDKLNDGKTPPASMEALIRTCIPR